MEDSQTPDRSEARLRGLAAPEEGQPPYSPSKRASSTFDRPDLAPDRPFRALRSRFFALRLPRGALRSPFRGVEVRFFDLRVRIFDLEPPENRREWGAHPPWRPCGARARADPRDRRWVSRGARDKKYPAVQTDGRGARQRARTGPTPRTLRTVRNLGASSPRRQARPGDGAVRWRVPHPMPPPEHETRYFVSPLLFLRGVASTSARGSMALASLPSFFARTLATP